jgi:hypothetical protein
MLSRSAYSHPPYGTYPGFGTSTDVLSIPPVDHSAESPSPLLQRDCYILLIVSTHTYRYSGAAANRHFNLTDWNVVESCCPAAVRVFDGVGSEDVVIGKVAKDSLALDDPRFRSLEPLVTPRTSLGAHPARDCKERSFGDVAVLPTFPPVRERAHPGVAND